MNEIKTLDSLALARDNYRDYGIYVAQGRAYPNILDGTKTVYKRAIYGMWKDSPRSIVKVAELAAAALPYHPHPTSVSEVIVSLGDLGNKFRFLKTQGNFGNKSKGIEPSADRYIGGMLSDLSLELICDSIEYCNMIPGEIEYPEPEALPTLVPLCFLNGMEGIPSGLPKVNIPSLDILGLFDYYIEILKQKNLEYIPKKLPIPNIGVPIISSKEEWEEVLKTGKGTIKVAPKIEIDKNGVIKISALPDSKTVDHVRKLIEKEILLDKIDLRDESTDTTSIVIERVYKKQCDMQEVYQRLYTKLQTNEVYNMAFFDKDHIYVPCAFDKVVKANLQYLIDTHKKRLDKQIFENKDKLLVLQIIENLKKSNSWKNIFNLQQEEAINWICAKFNCSEIIAQNVLKKPISYLTKEHTKEIKDLQNIIETLETDQSDIFEMLLKKYKKLKQKVSKEININTTTFINKKN